MWGWTDGKEADLGACIHLLCTLGSGGPVGWMPGLCLFQQAVQLQILSSVPSRIGDKRQRGGSTKVPISKSWGLSVQLENKLNISLAGKGRSLPLEKLRLFKEKISRSQQRFPSSWTHVLRGILQTHEKPHLSPLFSSTFWPQGFCINCSSAWNAHFTWRLPYQHTDFIQGPVNHGGFLSSQNLTSPPLPITCAPSQIPTFLFSLPSCSPHLRPGKTPGRGFLSM